MIPGNDLLSTENTRRHAHSQTETQKQNKQSMLSISVKSCQLVAICSCIYFNSCFCCIVCDLVALLLLLLAAVVCPHLIFIHRPAAVVFTKRWLLFNSISHNNCFVVVGAVCLKRHASSGIIEMSLSFVCFC